MRCNAYDTLPAKRLAFIGGKDITIIIRIKLNIIKMKPIRILISILLICLMTNNISSQTYVNGDVSGVWITENSPYIVTSDIQVPANDTLRIKPGVTVKFENATAFNFFGENKVLIAEGKYDSVIVFTSDNLSPSIGDWEGFYINGNTKVSLRNCIIEYAEYGINCSASASGCNSESSAFKIDSAIIRYNNIAVKCSASGSTGWICAPSSHGTVSMDVYNCQIYENGSDGFNLSAWDGDYSGGHIYGNILYNQVYRNGGMGINCYGDDPVSASIINNTIYGNDSFGVSISYEEMNFTNNIIARNETGVSSIYSNLDNFKFNNVWANLSDYDGLVADESNISVYPVFADTINNDFHLEELSPCIDGGDSTRIDSSDGTRSDIGAIPFIQLPVSPVLLTPFNGEITFDSIAIYTWQRVGSISNYTIQVSTDALFNDTLLDETLNTVTYTYDSLQPIHFYYWRVKANNLLGSGSWSNVNQFQTGAIHILTYEDIRYNDYFGYSVSISDGYAAVGSIRADGLEESSGAVYIYKENVGKWNFDDKILPQTEYNEGFFGASVSLDSTTILVGQEEDGSTGSALIYTREPDGWEFKQEFVYENPNTYDKFGVSVALYDDISLVGASGDDDIASSAGAGYIFKKDGEWIEISKITYTDADNSDFLGFSVDLDANNGIVGAYNSGTPEYPNTGAAFIINEKDNKWDIKAVLTPLDGMNYGRFGRSVAIDGDYAIVGCPKDNDQGAESGSVYIFKRKGHNWTEQTKLLPEDGHAEGGFGTSVSIQGNYAVVGAAGFLISSWSGTGAVYLFERNGETWNQIKKIQVKESGESSRFGYSLQMNNNVLIVGDPGSSGDTFCAYIIAGLTKNASEPILLSPNDLSVNNSIPLTFQWRGEPDVIDYYFQVSEDSTFTNDIIEITGISEDYTYIADLEKFTTYYWRVKTRNSLGQSSWSNIWKFKTIMDIPEIPVLLTPNDDSSDNTLSLNLSWQASERAEYYKILVADNDSFLDPVINDSVYGLTTNEISDLDYDLTYYWKVKAVNLGGESEWSEIWSFSTSDIPDNTGIIDLEEVEIYPIPMVDVLYIEGISEENSVATVYDLSGNIVKQNSGKGITDLSLKEVSCGIYFLIITNNKTTKTYKLIKE